MICNVGMCKVRYICGDMVRKISDSGVARTSKKRHENTTLSERTSLNDDVTAKNGILSLRHDVTNKDITER